MLISNIKLLEEKNPLMALKVGMYPASLLEADVTYVYGVGEVPFTGHRLIFFEDDMDRLYHFLHLEAAEKLLKDPRVYFYSTEAESIKKALWETALLSYKVMNLKGEGFASFKQELEYLREGIVLSICDVRDGGRLVLTNIIENATLSCFDGLSIRMPGVPAIVCGAGPTLEEHREWVRAHEKEALILACGSAIELVEEAHAGVCLDPAQPQRGYDKPLFYQNRLSHEFLKSVTGPRLNMGHAGGFPVEELFFGPDRFLDAGWNAGNFGVAVAKSLGCFPIVTVGIDHAGGYAAGINREKGDIDFKMAREWMEEQAVVSVKEASFIDSVRISFEASPLFPRYSKAEWMASWQRSYEHIKVLCQGPHPLHEVELEAEVVYVYYLSPLWAIWQYITPNRWEFFTLVLEERIEYR